MNRTKRRMATMALAGSLLMASVLPVQVIDAEGNIQVHINGAPQSYVQAPVIKKGSVMVPMRAIFESLGAQLKWDAATSTVHAFKGDDTVELTIDKKTAWINQQAVELNAAPIMENGHTMVPVRFIGESLGASVVWDAGAQTVRITAAEGQAASKQAGTDGPSPSTEANTAVETMPNGNANSEGMVAADEHWIYYTENGQLLKVNKNQSERIKLAEGVLPRFITVVGDWLYFANYEMNSSPLYKIRKDGSNLTKVTEESVWYVSKSGSWLVFNMVSDGGSLYRLDPNGGTPERITDDQAGVMNADENWIYYNNISEGNTFYKVRVDGSGRTKLNDTYVGTIQSVGDTLYYTSIFSLDLYRMNTDGTNDGIVAVNAIPFNVQGDWIYYIDIMNDRKLYKMKTDGSDRMKLSDHAADNILLAGPWIFYQNGDDASQMYTMRQDGSANQLAYLFTGQASDLNHAIVEDFDQEREDAASREALLAAERSIVSNRAGKTAEQIADEIIARLVKPDMSEIEKIKVLHDYLVRHVQYDYNNYLNDSVPSDSYTSYGALVNGIAVCQGYSTSMELLLTKAGIENIHVYGQALSYKGLDAHTWNMVKLDGQYYHLDVTWDDPVQQSSPYLNYDYFLTHDEDMALGHQWDQSQYPEAGDQQYAVLANALKFGVQYGDWYYYSDVWNDEQLYRIHLKSLKRERVIADAADPQLVSGGWLYYTLASDGNHLYRMKLDGSDNHKLVNQYVGTAQRLGDDLIYNSHFSIYKVSVDGGTPVKLSDDVPQGIVVTDEHIYYNTASADNGHIYRMNPDGSGKVQVDAEHSIRNFRIDGDWIYFSTIFPEKNGKMRLDGSDKQYFPEQ